MARQYKGPVRQKRKLKDGTYEEYGDFRGYHPGLQRVVGLGTRDKEEATRLLLSFHGATRPAVPGLSGHNQAVSSGVESSKVESKVIDLDTLIIETAPDAVTSDTLLSDWSKSTSDSPAPTVTEQPKPATATPTPSVFEALFRADSPKQTTPAAGPKAKKGQISPEVAAKVASGLKKTVTNLNMYVVGGCVSMFGRVPAPLDDEEIQLLETGWGLWLDEMLGKSQAKPWMLVALGNLSIAVSMYVQGAPKAKTSKVITNGVNPEENRGAPNMPADGSKLPGHAQKERGYDGKQWGKQ